MRRLLNYTTIGILALILPVAAFANITGTQTLTTGQGFSFDSGTVSSSGDILLGSSGITLQGGATAAAGTAIGQSGMASFNTLVAAGSVSFVGLYCCSAINQSPPVR